MWNKNNNPTFHHSLQKSKGMPILEQQLSGHLKIAATKSLPKKWQGNLQDETFLNMISRKLFNVTSFNQINCLLFN